jgi:hypothetical protein
MEQERLPPKRSYTIPCARRFRDAFQALARRLGVNVADLTRSVLLLVPRAVIEAFPDPGGPAADDRETVIVRSGPTKGRPWRRKPRIQVRLGPGYSDSLVRSAMALALALSEGAARIRVEDGSSGRDADDAEDEAGARPRDGEIGEEFGRLRALVSVLSFDPLPEGVRTRADALHVLGFAPESVPGAQEVRTRFRLLATVHHPDGRYGSHLRMSQLNAAMGLLRARAA